MSKFVENTYTNRKEILKFSNHSVQVAVSVDPTGIVADEDGRKIVKAGTIVGGKDGSTLADETKKVEKKNTQGGGTGTANAGVDAEGVLLYDVDVTHGFGEGAMIVHGFVDLGKLPEAPCVDAKTALKQITFLA